MQRMSSEPTLISSLFSAHVVTEEAVPALVDEQLFAEERAHVANAVVKRRAEFGTARVCARKALARLGIGAVPLVPHEDRAPRWPAGVVGSISHTHGYCGVAVARSERVDSLGLDVEQDKQLSPEIIETICTPAERTRLRDDRDALIYFGAKEAFYKCVYPLLQTFLDFQDVELDVDLGARSFTGRIIKPVASHPHPHGRFKRERGFLVCAAELLR